MGKKKAFQQVQDNADKYTDLQFLRNGVTLSYNEEAAALRFVGALYGKQNCTSLNSLRAHKSKSIMKVSTKRMPPTNDSFHQHVLRCQFQLITWKKANMPLQVLPDPDSFGYCRNPDGTIDPMMMAQPAAAPELLNDIICFCNNDCDDFCRCHSLGQPCTAACDCGGLNYVSVKIEHVLTL